MVERVRVWLGQGAENGRGLRKLCRNLKCDVNKGDECAWDDKYRPNTRLVRSGSLDLDEAIRLTTWMAATLGCRVLQAGTLIIVE